MKKIILTVFLLALPLLVQAETGIGVTGGFLNEILPLNPEEAGPNFWIAGINARWKQKIFLLDASVHTHVYPTPEWDDIWVFLNMGLCFDLFFLRISGGPGLIVVPVYDYNLIYKEEGRWPWRLSAKLNIDAKFGSISVGAYANLWLYIHPELGLQSANIGIFGVTLLYWL